MAEKRVAEGDRDQSSKKHRFNSSSAASKRRGQGVDERTGQRWAFGNLDAATIPTDGDLEWEDETDALAYLKSVRMQAECIPHVLSARKAGPELPGRGAVDRSIYEDGTGDFRGYYHDGAYTAYPEGYGAEDDDWEAGVKDGEENEQDNQSEAFSDDFSADHPRNSSSAEIHEAYYSSLAHQYQSLRRILQSKPPAEAVVALPNENPTIVGSFGASSDTFKEWSDRVRHTDPISAQIASMHKDSVIRLLRIILAAKFFRKGHSLRERTSRWIWALLARLPETGELDYQDIGWIRELGKRAVMFMLNLAELEVLREQYGVSGGGSSDGGAEVEVEEGIDEYSNDETSEGLARVDKRASTPQVAERISQTIVTIGKDASSHRDISAHTVKIGTPSREGQQLASPPSDVAMELDSEDDEGEVSTDPHPHKHSSADIETARAQLLAQLDQESDTPETPKDPGHYLPSSGQEPLERNSESTRDMINMRATLNMILTVAGEFYGQRDLLEFRDPFGRSIE